MARPKKTIVPESPKQDYKLGDLTPEYIEWYFENKSRDDFYAKYFGRRFRPQLHEYFKKYQNINK